MSWASKATGFGCGLSGAGHLATVAVDDAQVAQHDGPIDLRQLLSPALAHHLVKLVPRPPAVLVLEGWALFARDAGDQHIW